MGGRNMKYQLIMIPNQPILVSDEEIKEGEPGYSINNATYTHFSHLGSSYGRKIIAGVKDLPSVDFSALSEEECKKIGWVDVDKEWNKYYTKYYDGDYISFADGFKTAQSLNEKNCTCKPKIFYVEAIFENNSYKVIKIFGD